MRNLKRNTITLHIPFLALSRCTNQKHSIIRQRPLVQDHERAIVYIRPVEAWLAE